MLSVQPRTVEACAGSPAGWLDDRKNTRPSLSEIIVDLLTRHRDELDAMD
jgi:hypothetical protein